MLKLRHIWKVEVYKMVGPSWSRAGSLHQDSVCFQNLMVKGDWFEEDLSEIWVKNKTNEENEWKHPS